MPARRTRPAPRWEHRRNIGGHRQHHLGWQQGCSRRTGVVMLAWPGLVVHVAYLGRSGQENATAPIQPPRELMVRTVVPGALTEAVMLVLDAATVKVEGSLGADVVIAEVAVQ